MSTNKHRSLYSFVILLIFLSLITLASLTINYTWNWSAIWEYKQKLIDGWIMTLLLSSASLICSLGLALFFLFLQKSKITILSVAGDFWIQTIRGTPLLVQILIFYYVIGTALGVDNRFVLSILILSNFSASYIAEILRASLESIPQDHWETARSFGMTRIQCLRHIVIPQMFRLSLPGLAGQLCSLVKDSSLLSIIAVSELTLNAQEINSITYSTLEAYMPLAAGYLLMTWPITKLSKYLEKSFDYAH